MAYWTLYYARKMKERETAFLKLLDAFSRIEALLGLEIPQGSILLF